MLRRLLVLCAAGVLYCLSRIRLLIVLRFSNIFYRSRATAQSESDDLEMAASIAGKILEFDIDNGVPPAIARRRLRRDLSKEETPDECELQAYLDKVKFLRDKMSEFSDVRYNPIEEILSFVVGNWFLTIDQDQIHACVSECRLTKKGYELLNPVRLQYFDSLESDLDVQVLPREEAHLISCPPNNILK